MGSTNYDKNQECIVYLDCLVKNDNCTVDAYIDFRSKDDLNYYIESKENTQNDEKTNATYIELLSLKTKKRLRSGCYYKLNLDLIIKNNFEPNKDSWCIWRIYQLGALEMPNNDSEEILQSHKPLNPSISKRNDYKNNFSINLPNENLFLKVRNVDQANWNELEEGNIVKIVYDLGYKFLASKRVVKNIFMQRKNDFMRDKPILIISHWDIDHIHCLCSLEKDTIQGCFSQVICIDESGMKSLTSKKIFERICKALDKYKVHCISPVKRTDGITMHQWKVAENIAIYQGEKSRNINYSGICLFVHGNQNSVNFTGDVKLIQAKNVFEQESERVKAPYMHILIAPHHGGDCSVAARCYQKPITEVIVSVGGKNSYNHPNKHMLAYLKELCNNNVKKTNSDGDVICKI